jgi:hypothetical protein
MMARTVELAALFGSAQMDEDAASLTQLYLLFLVGGRQPSYPPRRLSM